MTEKLVIKEFEELKDGEPVTFFGVHVFRWNFATMGKPTVAFTTEEDPAAARLEKLERIGRALLKCHEHDDEDHAHWSPSGAHVYDVVNEQKRDELLDELEALFLEE